jgi:hypothetical protein
VPFLVGTLAVASSGESDVVFRFQDPEIVESSGLVVQDGVFLTVNDSGDRGRVFAVDPGTGRTVGVTEWAAEPDDVEALAPAGPGQVWVGDIGDNATSRDAIEVARVAVGDGSSPEVFALTYPERAFDAETLLAHPVTGRLYVASKVVFGGRLYAAPARLRADRANKMTDLGPVLPIATDGAFFPDGRHLVLRDYGRAVVYTFPALEVVGEVDLPDQRQGEGIAVAPDGTVYVSSEGRRAPVLEVALPERVREAVAGGPSAPSTGATEGSGASPGPTPPPGSREGVELPQVADTDRPVWPWFLTGWLGLGVIVVLVWALRRR